MKKSKIVAACLVNSRMIAKYDDAESAVRRIFQQEFPRATFLEWDSEIDDHVAENIIRSVGRASTINVKKFIEDLRNHENA
jgi:hypothetical protein